MQCKWIALVIGGILALPVSAENYSGFALGAAEFCEETGESDLFEAASFNDEFNMNYLSVSLREHF